MGPGWALLTQLRCTGQRVMDGLGLPPSLPHSHGDELNAFLEGLKCPWWFFFLPALIVGKHSFIRFSCRIAQAPGNTGAIALHRHTVPEMLSQPLLPLCRNCLAAAALWFEVPVLFPGMSKLSFSCWSTTWPFLYFFCSVQIQMDFCSSGPKFYFIQCFQH